LGAATKIVIVPLSAHPAWCLRESLINRHHSPNLQPRSLEGERNRHSTMRQDLTYALRALAKNAGFSAVAILSLALAIGANTTIFTIVNAVLLRPLPYPEPGRLVVLNEVSGPRATNPPAPSSETAKLLSVHPASYVEWQARTRSFEALVLVQTPPLNVMGAGGAEQISRMQATADLYRVFSVRPVMGRGFTDRDTLPGGDARIVILGYGFWQRWFGGDPGVLGRQLAVQDGSLTIIGVAPAGFRIGTTEPDAVTPLTIDPAKPGATGSRAFDCYGRLRAGVTLATAQDEMTALAAASGADTTTSAARSRDRYGVAVSSLHDSLVREARPALRLLMAVVATVLAIACVNLAGLLMARGIGRRGEFALRAALGAGRWRLIRQLTIESFVLAACGGAAGLAIAYWATRALVAMSGSALTGGIAGPGPIGLDFTSLLFTFAISAITTMVFGLAPARQASRVDPQAALKERTRGAGASGDRRHHRLRGALVITQVALAMLLLIGAGLLLRSLSSLMRVDLGFQPARTITMGLFLGIRPPETRVAMLEQMVDRVQNLPGVKAAGTIQFLPLRGMTCGTGFWREEDAAGRDPSRTLPTECALVSGGYFAAMGIPLLEGRVFDRRDRTGSTRVVIVNRAFAARYFPDGRVIGRRVVVQTRDQVEAEIVGVVGDVRHQGLTTDPKPAVFSLHAQVPGYITSLVVRTDGDPFSHATAIRRAIHEVDPTQAVSGVSSLEQDVDKVLARPRLQAVLVTCFAGIAVLLAVIGLYGLIAYVVSQRTHEIGIRLALGATRGKVFADLFGQGARLVGAGLAIGAAAAIALRQFVSSFVFGVTSVDPLTYVVAVVTFATVAFVAIVIPARRAARVEPMLALRNE
jgi:predicted permease